jgi:hypothetical protein
MSIPGALIMPVDAPTAMLPGMPLLTAPNAMGAAMPALVPCCDSEKPPDDDADAAEVMGSWRDAPIMSKLLPPPLVPPLPPMN